MLNKDNTLSNLHISYVQANQDEWSIIWRSPDSPYDNITALTANHNIGRHSKWQLHPLSGQVKIPSLPGEKPANMKKSSQVNRWQPEKRPSRHHWVNGSTILVIPLRRPCLPAMLTPLKEHKGGPLHLITRNRQSSWMGDTEAKPKVSLVYHPNRGSP